MIWKIILMYVSLYPVFFVIGVLHERAKWNKLIKTGVLPKPGEQKEKDMIMRVLMRDRC